MDVRRLDAERAHVSCCLAVEERLEHLMLFNLEKNTSKRTYDRGKIIHDLEKVEREKLLPLP